MKKSLLAGVAVCSLLTLFGCNQRSEMQNLRQQPQVAELKPMQQSYRGVIPCADCEGIETSLFLEKDGSWIMNQRYLGKGEKAVFASYGTWARTADKLVLTESSGEKHYFRPKGAALEMLDRQGNPAQSQFNYSLQPVESGLPTTPMAMKGKYRYMADAAIFEDCATGKTFAVASNADLERGYAVARGEGYQPVLLVLEAHFTLEPAPDSGALQKTLVADNDARFKPGKDCADE